MNRIGVVYLASSTLSMLGNSIAAVAMPLIVLQVSGSALGAGAVAAATAIPAILAGLAAGVIIDRINRRTSSMVADLISAGAVAALPLIDLISGLSIGWFILFGVIGSLGDVPGMTAREAMLPAIVRHGGVTAERLTGLREALGAVALLLGPAAAGTLMVLFEGSAVLWITAATSLAAAVLTLLVPHGIGSVTAGSGAPTPVFGSGWTQLREGWRTLFRNRFLVAVTVLSVLSVIVVGSLQGIILPVYFFAAEEPGLLGFVLSAMAAGTLVGGLAYALGGARASRRVWFVIGLIGTTASIGLIVTLASVWVVLAGAFGLGLASGVFGSLMGVLMIERIPEEMRGRIMGTQNSIMTAALPAGIVVAAVLVEFWGTTAAAIVVAAVWLIALAVGLLSRSLRTLNPGPARPAATETVVIEHAKR